MACVKNKISKLFEYRYVSGVYCCHLLLLFVNTTNSLLKSSILKICCYFLVRFVNDLRLKISDMINTLQHAEQKFLLN